MYYGEELVRLATSPTKTCPMHGVMDANAGFTAGKTSARRRATTTSQNVAAESADPASLLNWHKKMIRRQVNLALAKGRLWLLMRAIRRLRVYAE